MKIKTIIVTTLFIVTALVNASASYFYEDVRVSKSKDRIIASIESTEEEGIVLAGDTHFSFLSVDIKTRSKMTLKYGEGYKGANYIEIKADKEEIRAWENIISKFYDWVENATYNRDSLPDSYYKEIGHLPISNKTLYFRIRKDANTVRTYLTESSGQNNKGKNYINIYAKESSLQRLNRLVDMIGFAEEFLNDANDFLSEKSAQDSRNRRKADSLFR